MVEQCLTLGNLMWLIQNDKFALFTMLTEIDAILQMFLEFQKTPEYRWGKIWIWSVHKA